MKKILFAVAGLAMLMARNNEIYMLHSTKIMKK